MSFFSAAIIIVYQELTMKNFVVVNFKQEKNNFFGEPIRTKGSEESYELIKNFCIKSASEILKFYGIV